MIRNCFNSDFTLSIFNNDCTSFGPQYLRAEVSQVMAIEADFEGDRIYVVQFRAVEDPSVIAYSVIWGNRLVGWTPPAAGDHT